MVIPSCLYPSPLSSCLRKDSLILHHLVSIVFHCYQPPPLPPYKLIFDSTHTAQVKKNTARPPPGSNSVVPRYLLPLNEFDGSSTISLPSDDFHGSKLILTLRGSLRCWHYIIEMYEILMGDFRELSFFTSGGGGEKNPPLTKNENVMIPPLLRKLQRVPANK